MTLGKHYRWCGFCDAKEVIFTIRRPDKQNFKCNECGERYSWKDIKGSCATKKRYKNGRK